MTQLSPPEAWLQQTAARRSPDLRQERAVRTREQILFAAAELFAQAGFQKTSIKDVADRAGVTKGAIFFHYPTKEILATAVVEAHYSRWPDLLARAQAQGLSPLDVAFEVLDQAAVAFRDDLVVRAGARLQIERSLIDAPLPRPYEGWTDVLATLLRDARDSGELRPGTDPDAAARCLVASFFGTQHISDTLSQRADLLERWADMRELLALSLRP
ncbi:ScbR family autoregulator-binding transcription factor [Streptacidiphilus sp. N1-12]|uniref:ScbR family autoregulator-binding transcription factor n=2 Tax=Streptacidiphilus alkalitolerans TaxID=3342712 RepID=A0ABV6VB11_9ACTN